MFFAVYVLTNRERSIFYIGVTGTLADCISDHKAHQSNRSNCWRHCTRLVYFEYFDDVCNAIDRVNCLALRMESFQVDFISRFNPCWEDLSSDWYDKNELWFSKHWYRPLILPEWQ